MVRLKCGDPGIFGRGAEEAEALAAGIECEIVPGVTAASAAAAEAGGFLTERGRTDTLVLTTGTHAAGGLAPGWTQRLAPGTTMAIYMGVGHLAEVERDLVAEGLDGLVEAEIVGSAATPHMRRLAHPVIGLSAAAERAGIASPAIILLRRAFRARALAAA